MGNKDKSIKPPTEPVRFDDFWGTFKVEFLPFVEWVHDQVNESDSILVTFTEDTPAKYTNKWNREQYKIQVIQNGESKVLSGGKKLFTKIRSFMVQENKKLTELGQVVIERFGNGFDTDYSCHNPQ